MLGGIAAAALATMMLTAHAAPTATAAGSVFPIRAAFYYPWYPEHWQIGSHYKPSLGAYSSDNPATLSAHVNAMMYGNIGAGISSWWGQGTVEDNRFPSLLQAAAGTPFKWSIYYEQEAYSDPSVSQIASDLHYIQSRYASNPNFLTIDGRFVVFVYDGSSDSCELMDRWSQANAGINAYLVVKKLEGAESCANQPDAWHDYDPAVAELATKDAFSISPGFWRASDGMRCLIGNGESCLPRSTTRWAANVSDMVASGKKFQLVTTFNEWFEGTSLESATQWNSPSGYGRYLDALHNN